MWILVEIEDTDDIIGVKEDVAARLEGMSDIKRILVCEDIKND
jgi:hypothetical protein